MDKQYTRAPRFHFEQISYRSTSDLIPKCRSQALKAKRAAARSKINQIAKQLYELKYDHEWQQQQLKRLVNKGECIMKEVDQKIKKVQQEVVQLSCSAEPTIEGLSIQKIKFNEESVIASERSTQPEVQNDSVAYKNGLNLLYSQRLPAINRELRNNSMLKSAVLSKSTMLNSSQQKKWNALKSTKTKQTSIKSSLKKIPIVNVILFIFLVLIVLFLL